MPTAVKLSDELVESARAESSVWSRSMTQQIEHWARIGRSLERSGSVEMARVRAALKAGMPFDELSSEEKVVVLGELEQAVFRPEGDVALAARLRERGTALSGIDSSGRLASFLPDGRVLAAPPKKPAKTSRVAARNAAQPKIEKPRPKTRAH